MKYKLGKKRPADLELIGWAVVLMIPVLLFIALNIYLKHYVGN